MEAVEEQPSRYAHHITMRASQGAPDGPPILSCAYHTILNIFELWMNDIHCPGLHGRKLLESGPANATAAQLHEYWIVHWTGHRFHDRHIPWCQIYWSRCWLNTYTYCILYVVLSYMCKRDQRAAWPTPPLHCYMTMKGCIGQAA